MKRIYFGSYLHGSRHTTITISSKNYTTAELTLLFALSETSMKESV